MMIQDDWGNNVTIRSDSQMKTLAIIPHVTGTLFFLGSCSILYDIWRDRRGKMKKPYYRMLLGLSLFDLLSSAAFAVSTIPMPVDTPRVYGARGTTQTCTSAGFFNQLILGSMLYNLMLAIYYNLSQRNKLTDEEFAEKYEMKLHGIIWIVAVGIALVGLPLTVYNAGTVRCWIAPYPLGCSDSACTRGHYAIRFRLIAHIAPIWVTIIIITILMVVLTLSVRNEEKMAIAMRDTSVENASGSEQSNSINDDDLIVDNGHEDPNLNQTMPTVHGTQVDRIPQFKREGSVRLERTKKMFHQALLYVAVFYLT